MLSERELATVLAALRHWQDALTYHGREFAEGFPHFHEHKLLSRTEISELCERLNTQDMDDEINAAQPPANDPLGSLARIEAKIDQLLSQSPNRPPKDWYAPAEAAAALGKATYTVREWCRYKRINARKRPVGRGSETEWEISSEEIERIRNHGLLPAPTTY